MSVALGLSLLLLCVLVSGAYSGSEIGFYSLSRAQVDIEARQGRPVARLVAWLLERDASLLITILIGNNLAIELATHVSGELFEHWGVSEVAVGVVVTVVLTPILFIFGEALPKDIFRRRPHALVHLVAPFIALSRIAFWPLERLLSLLSLALERTLRLEPRATLRLRGRERVLHFFAEGRRSGVLPQRAEALARNALTLRILPVRRAMQPWSVVERLDETLPQDTLYQKVRDSRFSRLPVVDGEGQVLGYVHQLDVLMAGPEVPVIDHLRTLPRLTEDVAIDRALLTLRGSGQRAAIVVRDGLPVGLVTLKDLVEEISGDLAHW